MQKSFHYKKKNPKLLDGIWDLYLNEEETTFSLTNFSSKLHFR